MNSNIMKVLGAAALFASAANAHMIMAQPVPVGKPDNSPLSASGSDYPCKLSQTNNFQGTAATMQSGSQQTLSFSGSAVHAGGSCQLSLTKDSTPSKSSSFKVIHSYLGACPGTGGTPSTFQYTMPSEVPDGSYVLGWTWFNNVGNREMYMNCASVKVTGSSGSDSSFSGLPDMAIYNLADINKCTTIEGKDVEFPNPGKYVTKDKDFNGKAPIGCGSGGSSPAGGSSGSGASAGSGASSGSSGSSGASPSGGSGSSGSFGEGSSGGSATTSANNGQYTGLGAGSGNSGAGSAGSASSASSGSGFIGSAASGAADSSPTATSLLTVYTTQTGSGSAPTGGADSGAGSSSGSDTSGAGNGTSSTGSTGSGSSGTDSSSSSSSSGSSSGSSTGGSTAGGSCSPDGSMVCSADGAQYGLCNWGAAVMMPVAAGTKCSGGQIMRRANFKS